MGMFAPKGDRMARENRPGLRDLFCWLLAYPHLNSPLQKTIWWAVFKEYWLWPAALIVVALGARFLLFDFMK
jgi:hypothetical protein